MVALLDAVAEANWPLITQAIAAAAGCVAAIAAWRSASASRATSHDALRALAIGIEPRLQISVFRVDADRDEVHVSNRSEWEARSVDVQVTLKSGVRRTNSEDRLRPMLTRTGEATGDGTVNLGPGGDTRHPEERVREIRVLYWDSNKINQYAHTETYPGDPPLTRDIEKISGP